MNIIRNLIYLTLWCLLGAPAVFSAGDAEQVDDMNKYRERIENVIETQGCVLLAEVRAQLREKLTLPFAVGGLTHAYGDAQANLGWELFTDGKPLIRAIMGYSLGAARDRVPQWVTVEVVFRDDDKEEIIPRLTVRVAPVGCAVTGRSGESWNPITEELIKEHKIERVPESSHK